MTRLYLLYLAGLTLVLVAAALVAAHALHAIVAQLP